MPNMLFKHLRLMPNFEAPDKGAGGNGDGDNQNKDNPKDGGNKDDGGDGDGDDPADKGGDKAGKGGEDELARLTRELAKANDEKASLLRESLKRKEDLKAFKDIDPEKYRELLDGANKAEEERLEAERKAAEKSGDFDRVKQMMADAHKTETTELREEIDRLKGAVSASVLTIEELSIGSSFNGSEYITKNLVLTPAKVRALYGSHFEIEDGKVVAYDKPVGSASRTKLVNSVGEPVSFEAAIAKIIEADPDKDTMLRSKVKPGAGSRHDGGGKSQPKTPNDGLTGIERMRANAANLLNK